MPLPNKQVKTNPNRPTDVSLDACCAHSSLVIVNSVAIGPHLIFDTMQESLSLGPEIFSDRRCDCDPPTRCVECHCDE